MPALFHTAELTTANRRPGAAEKFFIFLKNYLTNKQTCDIIYTEKKKGKTKMKQKFRVGDRVYPIYESALVDLKTDDVDVKDFVGIITQADRKTNGRYEYSIVWLDWERINELGTLWNAWWEEDQLTLDRDTFLELVEDCELPDYLDEDEDFDEEEDEDED